MNVIRPSYELGKSFYCISKYPLVWMVWGRMSRGQFRPETHSARAALRRCNRKNSNKAVIIDVDVGKIDVIFVDSPESSSCTSRRSSNPRRKNLPTVIHIDDEGDGDDIEFRNADHCATSSKTFHPSSVNSYTFKESDSDECQLLTGKGKSHTESPKWMFDTYPSECSTSTSDTSESGIVEGDILETKDSESDSSDCEIMDGSSGNIREEWEKAALKRKIEKGHTGSKEGTNPFECHDGTGVASPHEASQEVDVSASADTCTVQTENNAHSNASVSTNRMDDPLAASDRGVGFTEEPSHKGKRKDSGILDHMAGEDSNEQSDSKSKNGTSSNTNSLHRSHSQPEGSFEAMANLHGQDTAVPRPFSCDRWMQHTLHGHIDGLGSIDSEDNERAAAEVQDKPPDEDMHRNESPSYSNIPYSSQNLPCFQPHGAYSEPSNCQTEQHTDMLGTCHTFEEAEAISEGSLGNLMQEDVNPGKILQSNLENMGTVSDFQNGIIGERERHKESEEYKHAEEEEWASRQRQLQIQSEEAQRLRKRKKAENLRLLDMEKRQKQRVEEIRESQKRVEETINLKEQLRAEIRKELAKLEMRYRDMASLLRGLGITVGGGPYPMSHEVNAAYKQALLRFHPDRASRADIRQQVEAEEKFKLISRLKEKLLPVAY